MQSVLYLFHPAARRARCRTGSRWLDSVLSNLREREGNARPVLLTGLRRSLAFCLTCAHIASSRPMEADLPSPENLFSGRSREFSGQWCHAVSHALLLNVSKHDDELCCCVAGASRTDCTKRKQMKTSGLLVHLNSHRGFFLCP